MEERPVIVGNSRQNHWEKRATVHYETSWIKSQKSDDKLGVDNGGGKRGGQSPLPPRNV